MNKIFFSVFTLIICLSFSCASDQKFENTQENNSSINANSAKIISIYLADNSIDLWHHVSGKYQVGKSEKFPIHLFFPLGIQEIKSIQKDGIIIELPSNEVASKLKTKQLKTSFLDSMIPFEIPALEKSINLNDYTLIVLPSKPDEFGNFKACTSCPFNEQELYLKCKLEWESIFGNFEEVPEDGISDSDEF